MGKTSWQQSIFSPVLQEDMQAERVSRLTRHVILVLLAASLVMTGVAAFMSTPRTLRLSTLSLAFFAAAYLLQHLKRIRTAALLTVSFLLFIAFYSVFTGDGIHDVAIILFPTLLLVASLLLSKGMFAFFAVLAVASVAVTGIAELYGWVDNKYVPFANRTDVVLAVVLTAATGFLVRFLVDALLRLWTRSRQSEQNYRQIFNAVSEALFIHDADTGKILDVNESMLKMYGYSRDEITQLTPETMCVDEEGFTAADARNWIQKALKEGPQFFVWRAKRKNGEPFWTEVNLTATMIGGEGRVLAVVRDINEKKMYEEELRQSEKMRAIGQLAGGVAHDFNNQVSGIMGFAEVLRTDLREPEQIDCLDYIIKSAERAASLTNQLLSFARKGKTEHKQVDMNAIVDETIAMLQRLVDRKIEISADKEEQALRVTGDSGQLQNALLNLAINARGAMPEGGEIRFTTCRTELDADYCKAHSHKVDPGDYVKVSVTDTGEGIPADIRERIFEPFFTTKEKGRGTGMGLAAVFGTVKEHAGAIEVYSEAGSGSVFTLYLPAAFEPDSTQPTEERQGPPPLQHGKVMIVDDEEILRVFAVRMLETEGYETKAFSNGRDAAAYYDEHHENIDVIVLDLVMPEMSGHETFTHIRSVNPDAKIIIASGYSSNGEIESLLNRGVGAFIQKPYKKHELLAAMARIQSD